METFINNRVVLLPELLAFLVLKFRDELFLIIV
jgi:hypothetical protein